MSVPVGVGSGVTLISSIVKNKNVLYGDVVGVGVGVGFITLYVKLTFSHGTGVGVGTKSQSKYASKSNVDTTGSGFGTGQVPPLKLFGLKSGHILVHGYAPLSTQVPPGDTPSPKHHLSPVKYIVPLKSSPPT